MDELIVTVSQLNEYISRKLYRDSLMQNIRVQGEITNFKFHSNGSVYFSLKDSISAIPCVMFENTDAMPQETADGKKVVVTASVNYYTREGRLQLVVQKVELSGLGELYLQFEQTKKRLYEEGLFDERYKKPLPLLPFSLGVVTSAAGAAMHDIIQVAKRRFPSIKINIYPVKVQGTGAADEVAEGIEYFNRAHLVDVIIIGRGGGSFEDLSAFNEETVARAIFASKIPVISAVGHEIDMTISDYTADLRAPTPSAAAELCVPDRESVLETLKNTRDKLTLFTQSCAAAKKSGLDSYKSRLMQISPEKMAVDRRNELNNYKNAIAKSISTLYTKKLNAVQIAKSYISAFNPYDTLKRGYAFVKNKAGHAVSSIKGLNLGENVQIVLFDGLADAKINKIETNGGAG